MVGRVWHGYTTHDNADVYESILRNEVIPGIASMEIEGYRRIVVFRRKLKDEVEFITIMWFDSLDEIKAFTGEDYERSHVPSQARAVLKRFDDRSAHYDIVETIEY